MNLDFAKVCGKHNAVYEAYYKQIDPKGSGAIEAMTAAKFLKKSGLSDVVLSRVWDLSDPNGKGFLDKPGFFVALKLVSLAQVGLVINMSNIYMETANPPKVGDLPKITPPHIQPMSVGYRDVGSNDWTISVIDRLKYDQLFESLKPVGGMLPGNKVKGVLMDSKLPMDTLGKIWDLADQDKDGNLDKHEFIVAMHLVYQTLEKRTVPDVLPTELRKAGAANIPPPPKPAPPVVMSAGMSSMPRAPSGEGFGDAGFVANFPKDIGPPPAIPPLPSAVPAAIARLPTMGTTQPLISTAPLIPIGAPPSLISTADWVVVPSELKRYEVIFRDSDRDKDGLVSGLEVKNVFLQSGVSQNCLAHIWALCDTNQSGKLTLEQFALAMWMVERKQNGIEPPQVLTANMVPPSMRGTESVEDLKSQEESKSTYSNPELNMISKEIEELANERRMLETDIAQREADIRIKSGEVRSLQSELDTLTATLKQLENQKGEAQKRLDDLKAQVNKIREQCQKQEDTINEQEGELNAKRSELQKLKDEEAALQKEYDENNRELLMLTQHLQNTQLKISSVRSMVSQLLETQRQMTDALLMCRAAIESQNGELVSEYQLKIEPDFSDAQKTLEKTWNEVETKTESNDPFINADRTTNEFGTNGFGGDPFSAISRGSHSGFDDSFSATRVFDSGFDAFGNSKTFGQQHDLFDGESFIGSQLTQSAEITELGRNEFGNDPFAALHAPTGQGQVLSPNAQRSLPPPRPESPSPALPPKKSKVPPPRPAPPRPIQAPGRPTPMDNSGHAPTSAGIDGTFADFADFDNKLSNIPIPSPTTAKSTFPVITSTDTIGKTWEVPSIFEMKASASSLQPSLSTTLPENISTILVVEKDKPVASNHLVSVITPLLEAASGLKGPTDFSDDPFKDYRYEDPFSIQDPFADNSDDGCVFQNSDELFRDDSCSEDGEKKNHSVNTSASIVKSLINGSNASQSINTAAPHPSNDLQRKLEAIAINSSTLTSAPKETTEVTTPDSVTKVNYRCQSVSPDVPVPLFDAFVDFDSVSSSSKPPTVPIHSLAIKNNTISAPSPTTESSTDVDNDSHFFFNSFNDHFDSNSNISAAKWTTMPKISDTFKDNHMDAFGSATKMVDEFNENQFEDDFFHSPFKNSDSFTMSDSKNIQTGSMSSVKTRTRNQLGTEKKLGTINGSPEECSSEFKTALNNSINFTNSNKGGFKVGHLSSISMTSLPLVKVQNNSASAENDDKLTGNFTADYSKPETFEADLEEVLKRSVMDKYKCRQ